MPEQPQVTLLDSDGDPRFYPGVTWRTLSADDAQTKKARTSSCVIGFPRLVLSSYLILSVFFPGDLRAISREDECTVVILTDLQLGGTKEA